MRILSLSGSKEKELMPFTKRYEMHQNSMGYHYGDRKPTYPKPNIKPVPTKKLHKGDI